MSCFIFCRNVHSDDDRTNNGHILVSPSSSSALLAEATAGSEINHELSKLITFPCVLLNIKSENKTSALTRCYHLISWRSYEHKQEIKTKNSHIFRYIHECKCANSPHGLLSLSGNCWDLKHRNVRPGESQKLHPLNSRWASVFTDGTEKVMFVQVWAAGTHLRVLLHKHGIHLEQVTSDKHV